MMLQIGVLVLCGALPGLLLRRFGPWPARLGALLALGAILFGVVDLDRETLTREPAVVAVVPTGPWSDKAGADLRERMLGKRESAVVQVLDGPTAVADRLATARLRAAAEPQLVLLWNGGRASESAEAPGPAWVRNPGGAPAAPGRFLSDVAASPFDPRQVEVRALGPLAERRPGALALRLPAIAAASETRIRLRVLGPGGDVALDHAAPGAPQMRVEWTPTEPGAHRVLVDVEHGGVRFQGKGQVGVLAPPGILVIGDRAQNMVRALAVQGIVATAAAALPARLDGTIVALDPLPASAQRRLAAFVRDGGGLLLVGGVRGGAVPGPGDPLADLCPVVRLPLPEAAPKLSAGGPEDPSKKPPEKKPDPPPAKDPPKDPPEDPPPKSDPGKDPPGAAKGETKGARKTGKERVVERRSIAMVLLVDGSGSMDELVKVGVKRIDIARSSALQTALALDEDDQIGVVSFGERRAARVELPMTPVKNTQAIREALSGLHARARDTRVRDGLRRARLLLAESKAAVKYVIVVTDGVITDVRDAATHSEARKCGAAGVTVVVVQVLAPGVHGAFDAASQTLALVKRANGQLVQQRDFDAVPKVISSEVERIRSAAGRPRRNPKGAAGKEGAKPPGKAKTPEPKEQELPKPPPKGPDEQPEAKKPEERPDETPPPPEPPEPPEPPARLQVHIVEDAALLEPRPASGQFPSVGGILPVRGRADARTLLAAGPEGLPLLALANRGLGRVGVWTSDLFGPWGELWAEDPGFPGWVAQWVAALAPPARSADSARLLAGTVPTQDVIVPRVRAQLEGLMGSALAPVESFVPPPPQIRTEVEGAAADHAWYGVLFLLLLVGLEFLSIRRRPGGSDHHARR